MDCFGYFREFSYSKAFLYTVATMYVAYVSIACFILQPILPLCEGTEGTYELKDFRNPAYNQDPCRQKRFPILLWMTVQECDFGRRIVFSALFGALIGWERRQADRPAGIRTMALVSLGSCLFSICSAFAFISGPMNWDGSRVSAAIPSGVGFLGAGIIFKQAEKDEHGEMNHTVRGLTTAASLWLSAAVGIACGGELYFPALFTIAVTLLLLRFGPRITEGGSAASTAGMTPPDSPPASLAPPPPPMSPGSPIYQSVSPSEQDPEMQSMLNPRGSSFNRALISSPSRRSSRRPNLME